jgi:hypothetical protein
MIFTALAPSLATTRMRIRMDPIVYLRTQDGDEMADTYSETTDVCWPFEWRAIGSGQSVFNLTDKH